MNQIAESTTVRIVLQARMGSTRRPGKTLADIGGRPLLARCLERLDCARRCGIDRRICGAWQIVVATSAAPADDAVEDLARQMGFDCVRGSESNVLSRYIDATADLGDDDVAVRATADNPLYCPELTTSLVAEHLQAGDDYTGIAEALSPCVPEAMRIGALRRAASQADLDDYCREHVTPYFRRPETPFRSRLLPTNWRGLDARWRLTVDTPEDIQRMSRLYDKLTARYGDNATDWKLSQIYGAAATLGGLAATHAKAA